MAPKRQAPKNGTSPDDAGGATLGSCMAAIGVSDAAARLGPCADLDEEFAILKKAYMRTVLKTHPDKGGDAATFQATRSAFEVIRNLFEAGAIASFASATDRPTTTAYTSASRGTGTSGVPSWEFYAAAAETAVPRHRVELARSARSKCKAEGAAKKCAAAVGIDKSEVRVGTLDLEAGGYGRPVHLACWRVPAKVWLGLPDPAKAGVAQFEEALARMGGVQLAGVGEMGPEGMRLFAKHCMDRKNWARLMKRKEKAEGEAAGGAGASSAKDGGGGPSQARKKVKTEKAGAAGTSTALVTKREDEPKKFVVPVPGKGSAVATSMAGETVVMTGLFPEIGGGAGLSLGKARAKALVESFGGRVTGSISGKTTLLLVGKQPGMSKVSTATGKGLRMMGLKDLVEGLNGGRLKSAKEVGPMQIDSFSAGYRGNGLVNRLTASEQEQAMRLHQPVSRKALPAPAKRRRA